MLELVYKYAMNMGYTNEQLNKYYNDCLAAGHPQENMLGIMVSLLDVSNLEAYTIEMSQLNVTPVQEVQPEPQPEQVVQEAPVQEITQHNYEEMALAAAPQAKEEIIIEPNTGIVETTQAIVNDKNSITKQIEDLVYQLSILEASKGNGGPCKNDNHLVCPSYNNLIPEVQNLIVRKRELSINKMWFEKYRPEVIEEVLFPNPAIKETISQYVKDGRIAGHCMLYGSGGVGKTTVNIVLMNAVLKHSNDRFYLDRKVDDIDKLKGWLNKKPMGQQKIVIAEEFDRLSDAAQTELKNGLLEKYDDVVYLASTNRIHKIDSALLTRFTFVAQFDKCEVHDLFKKLKYILTNEKIAFNDEDLLRFTENNAIKGIRTILNNLQLSCNEGVFYPDRTAYFIGNSGTEFELVQAIKNYINYCLTLDVNLLSWLEFSLEYDKYVLDVRNYIYNITNTNYSLNWDYVFNELMSSQLYLPAKNLIGEYYQNIELVKIKSFHTEALLNEILTTIKNSKTVKA